MMTLTPAYGVVVKETIICKYPKRKVKRERINVLKSFSLQKTGLFLYTPQHALTQRKFLPSTLPLKTYHNKWLSEQRPKD